jgi:tetratricopeptide (TPR) repeat protein
MRLLAHGNWQLESSKWHLAISPARANEECPQKAGVSSILPRAVGHLLFANSQWLICRSFFFAALLLCSAALGVAQDNPDPEIRPRRDAPATRPKRQPKQPTQVPDETQQQPEQPAPPAPQLEQRESSSNDSRINLDAQPRPPQPAETAGDPDDKLLLPYDPHRAEKDIEVGNYYLRLKNYRAALDRFNDALRYKPHDADATYGLAVTEEKLDLLSQAYQNYQAYLKLLPGGPHAKEAQDASKRLERHLDIKQDSTKEVQHDIEVGETYLSMNNFDAARERFEEAVRLAPENAKACFRLAQSLQGLRQIEPARLYYQKYLELEPQGRFAADAKKAIAAINDFLK